MRVTGTWYSMAKLLIYVTELKKKLLFNYKVYATVGGFAEFVLLDAEDGVEQDIESYIYTHLA